MSRQDLFHNFFHGGCNSYAGSTVSFNDNRFYSYATVIGIKLTDDEGEEWLMTSYWNMSSTTCKHLYALRAACPHNNIMSVPMYYGEVVYDASDVAYNFKHWAEDINENSFKKRDNRLEFISIHKNWIRFTQRFKSVCDKLEWFQKIHALLDDYRKIVDGMEEHLEALHKKQEARTDEEIKAAREKRRLAEERKRERAKAMTADIMAIPYLTRVRLLFDPASVREHPAEIPLDAWKVARQLMTASGYEKANSFIWPYGDRQVKTSQGVIVNLANVLAAMRAYKNSKSTAGLSIDGFNVAAVTDDYVRVGCHHIPIENIKALAEAYGINW